MPTVSQSRNRAQTAISGDSRMGDWQLVRLLGLGSWFQVYQARPAECTGNAADYVVKTPRTDRKQDGVAVEMLCREVGICRMVCHPNLSTILAAQLDSPPYYVVSAYMAGGSLARTIEACGPLIVPHALWVARQIASALAALHESGWLHSDVKPANVFLASNGHVTLLDLGLACSVPINSQASFVGGTPRYAAPEWYAATTAPCAASDIYSLGMVLFEMLTGKRLADIGGLLPAGFCDPRRLAPSLPREVVPLLRRMLSADPQLRPTATELESKLTRLEIETLADRGV